MLICKICIFAVYCPVVAAQAALNLEGNFE